MSPTVDGTVYVPVTPGEPDADQIPLLAEEDLP
jgi:hypothetical protein